MADGDSVGVAEAVGVGEGVTHDAETCMLSPTQVALIGLAFLSDILHTDTLNEILLVSQAEPITWK